MSINLLQGSVTDVYLIDSIYDPDVHTDPAASSGKTVPAVGSIVVDNRDGAYILWIVDAVDPETRKTTYKAPRLVDAGIDQQDRLISYGNDTVMLYYDNRSAPTRCIIDGMFVMVGGASAEYRLLKTIGGVETVISEHLDSGGSFVSDRVPVVETEIAGVRKPTDCHTTFALNDGEFVTLQVFDSAGVLTTECRMLTKRSTILNDHLAMNNPIVEFRASANQLNGSDWVLYTNQNPEDLAIFPEIIYADGMREPVTIDNVSTFIYGLEDVDTEISEVEFPIMVKHFLSDNVSSNIGETVGSSRFLVLEAVIRIIPREVAKYTKISAVPRWSVADNKWDLEFFGYFETRERSEPIVGSRISYIGTPFDGTKLGELQTVRISATQTLDDGSVIGYTQTIVIKVNAPDALAPFTIAEDVNSVFVYGVHDSNYNAPKLHFDNGRGTYFFPTSRIPDAATFLDTLYTQAEAPFLAGTETEAPVPSHFVIREVGSGRSLVAAPIAVNQYDQEFNLLSLTSQVDEFVDDTVIVEFLQFVSDRYIVLYGVPATVDTGLYNV